MTNHWIDIKNSDCILIMGSNAAENHPVSFKYVTEAMEKGATLISVDPRFTRTSSKADIYAPLRSGTDIAFLGGMIKYILDNDLAHTEYLVEHTNAPFLINPDYRFEEGPLPTEEVIKLSIKTSELLIRGMPMGFGCWVAGGVRGLRASPA